MSFSRREGARASRWLRRVCGGRRGADTTARPGADLAWQPPADLAARPSADPRHILLLKTHDQLGDFLVATPAMAALRARHPGARLTLVTREFLAPLALHVPDLDDVIVLPHVHGIASAGAFARALARVVAARSELAIVLNSVSRSRTADALAALSGAGTIIGRSRVGDGPPPADAPADPPVAARERGTRDALYDLDIEVAASSDHQIERVMDLVRAAVPGAPAPAMRLALSDAERATGLAVLEQAWRAAAPAGVTPGPEPPCWIGIHPGAANPLKCWPLERFVELGAAIAGGGARRRLVVFDAPRERGRAGAVHAGLLARGVRAAFVPAAGIIDFAAASAHLALLACNDSGVLHVAAALSVPTLSFHALGRPSEWAPRGDHAVAFYAERAIETLAAAPAVAAAERLLAGS